MNPAVVLAISVLCLLAGLAVGWLIASARASTESGRHAASLAAAEAQVSLLRQQGADARTLDHTLAPVSTSLRSLTEQVERAERARITSQAELRQQVASLGQAGEYLTRETSRLVSALRRSEVRGKWGELQLRTLVESAGLLEGVHFVEQDSVRTDSGLLRPDMVVKLGGDRVVLIDSKTPLDAFLDAELADDDQGRDDALRRHAAAVGTHVDQLASKEYWRHFEGSAEMVVLFLPAESLLSAALSRDPGLLDRAFAKKIVLATPTTLGALLRTVALAWRHQQLAENAKQVQHLGSELHGRLVTLTEHVSRLGQSLDTTVRRYNDTVGSLESRVLVTARRMSDLGVAETTPDTPQSVTTLPRVTGTLGE
jgi:DNA recombination protein RmuC